MADWWENFFLSGWYRELEGIPAERTEMQADFVVSALGLVPGERLLDVCCGIGRHSHALAARGLSVVGLDYTPTFLRRAVQSGPAVGLLFGSVPSFVRGDMRRIPARSETFDAAVNLFTSFGYFQTDEEHESAIHEVARILRPGGRFLIDTFHHTGVAAAFLAADWNEIPGGYLLQKRDWDARRGRADSEWIFIRDGKSRAFPVSIRAYTCPEMERMLAQAGMQTTSVWGGWDGRALTLDSRRLIIAAKRRTS